MEEFKNEVLMQLSNNPIFTKEMLLIIDQTIGCIMRNYQIERMCTDLVVQTIKRCPELDAFIIRKEFRGLSADTIKQYRYLLNNFVAWLDKDVKDVIADDIRTFLQEYSKINNISDRTKDSKRLILCSFYQFLHQNGYIKENPAIAVEPIKYKQKIREPLSHMEVELIRKACKTDFDEALFETFYSTGCRVSEVANMKISDIDFEKEQIKVCGKGDKERFVLLTPRAHLSLKIYLEKRNDNNPGVFVSEKRGNKPLGKCSLENRIRELGQLSGIGRTITPHIIRHTTASHLLEHTELDVVQELLGHTKIETTRIYAKTSCERIKSEFKKASL